MSTQTFRYLVCGGLNWVVSTLVYAGSYNLIFLRKNFDLGFTAISPHIAALGIQLPITFLLGFWLQKNISFKSAPLRNTTQLFRYLFSSLVALLLTYVCMKFFVEVCHIYPTPSNIITYMITAIFSFVAQKYYTFRGAEKE
jgi:putative flippase GtrA